MARIWTLFALALFAMTDGKKQIGKIVGGTLAQPSISLFILKHLKMAFLKLVFIFRIMAIFSFSTALLVYVLSAIILFILLKCMFI